MMPFRRSAPALCLLAIILLAAPPASARLYITEFLAENSDGLRDSDGDSSDWIELFNSGPVAVNLGGYFLTDDESALTKWPIPSVQLDAGQFLLVFASEKDRRVVGQELHTNFKLDQQGEYLGLIAPDGSSVVSDFGSTDNPLPRQREDISYGLMQTGNRTSRVLLARDAAAKVHVPTTDADATLGTAWTEIPFDDEDWRDAATGVGYDENSTYIPEFGAGGNLEDDLNGVSTTLYLRVPFELTDASAVAELSLRMKYDDGFAAYLNGTWVESENAPSPQSLDYDSEATSNHTDSSAVTYQEFDLTSQVSLLRNGTNILAIHGLNDGIGSSDMLISPELHSVQVTNPSVGEAGFLGNPTPGAYNGDTFAGFVEDTKFSINRGFYTRPFQLQLTSATEGAEIRYTLDGSTPSSTSGQVYRNPITISETRGTRVVRAMAHKSGFQPTNVDTHTYIFPSDVGFGSTDSLRAVPSISLITQNSGFLNEGGSNIREEYAASIEMIYPDGREGFQENGGISNYGGRFTNFRKKSFRVAFRERFGKTKVRYPIFEGFQYKHHPPAEVFDVINLRSGSHDMNSRGAYMSNRFTDDTMLDMGNIGPHGRFVHVYLNGRYWGQYHMRERWSADMASSYFGGPKGDYEAVNANDNFRNDEEVYDGPGQFWSTTKSLVAGSDPFNNASDHIDVANIIDFMLVWVSGDSESEFRAIGSSIHNIPFKFMIKDADGYLRGTSSGKAGHAGPLSVMSRMKSGLGGGDFRILVADRIHKHFFNDGAFTPANNIERLRKRVDEARPGFISEAARWNFRSPGSWESYQSNLMSSHFPGLTNTMIGRFRSQGMYPDIIAPVFSQHGGSVLRTTPVTMSTDADTIYYTLDGSDPRLPGGIANPTASLTSFGGGNPADPPQTFITTGHVWKFLDDGSDQGTAWRENGFDDSSWSEGPSELGYGSDGEGSGTTVSFGPNSNSKYATTYFRTDVDIPDPSNFLRFTLRLKYDDAAAVYLNGSEILRTPNLPANADYDQYASSTTSSEDSWFDYTIPVSSFRAGINNLAVEVHQASGTSSDMRMDMVLRGETTAGGGGGGDNVSDPIFFTEPARLRARAYNNGTGEWSALNEALFTIDTEPAAPGNLVIAEMHYHPASPETVAESSVSNDRDDYEFLEFLNIGPRNVDLTDVRFSEGINFTFPENTVLASGARLLLLRNRLAYEARYGSLPSVQWFEYTGRLSNDGETVIIRGSNLEPILDFTYNDQLPWPTAADGAGPSMVLVNPSGDPDHGEAANWTASRNPGGSPGTTESSGVDYASWAATSNVQGGPNDDDDHDTISNFMEFLHGSRPDAASDAPGLQVSAQRLEVNGEEGDYLVITYQKNLNALGTLTIELSSDLITWNSGSNLTEFLTQVDNGNGTATVTVRLKNPVRIPSRSFARLRGE
ncbi:MAG: lamin tail domain-containing protein [Roseibacillus sp.]|nr:lamin tail domain-containing protein [Roseibacillus sp.]